MPNNRICWSRWNSWISSASWVVCYVGWVVCLDSHFVERSSPQQVPCSWLHGMCPYLQHDEEELTCIKQTLKSSVRVKHVLQHIWDLVEELDDRSTGGSVVLCWRKGLLGCGCKRSSILARQEEDIWLHSMDRSLLVWGIWGEPKDPWMGLGPLWTISNHCGVRLGSCNIVVGACILVGACLLSHS